MGGEKFVPSSIDWEPNIGQESFGWEARIHWQNVFEGRERIFRNSEIVNTGVGGGISMCGDLEVRRQKRHGDGQKVPWNLENLGEVFGKVPETLFLIASAFDSGDLISVLSLAGEYKRTGEVKQIIPVLTAFPHERQDHAFVDVFGNRIAQPTTLRTAIQVLAGTRRSDGVRLVDGAVVVGGHSGQIIRHANKLGFPILPVDPHNFMLSQVGIENLVNPIVFGPDKGRTQIGRRMAMTISEETGQDCHFAVCEKARDRLDSGNATVRLEDPRFLDYITEKQSTVIVVDDEIREGTTSAAIRRLVSGRAGEFIFVANKCINACCKSLGKTAAELLSEELEKPFLRGERVIVSDAVEPLYPVTSLGERLEVVSLQPELVKIIKYLQEQPLPNGENWLMPKETGSSLFLDLGIEGYQLEERPGL
ncbi:MAG: phosphoribosyltransferase [Candidatus Beckwithbacteria bacterium]|nr:phosphoribosyltransferase [Patescibacteria group bacterium]